MKGPNKNKLLLNPTLKMCKFNVLPLFGWAVKTQLDNDYNDFKIPSFKS